MTLSIPRSWLKHRVYFVMMPQREVVVETVSLSRKEAKRKAEAWSGAAWAHLQDRRYRVDSFRVK